MLKQVLEAPFDERMGIAIPDKDAVNLAWKKAHSKDSSFENIVISMTRELAKLNPQNHAHVSELYSAINICYRCPPAPLMSLLATSSKFSHVGDLHYRLSDAEDD